MGIYPPRYRRVLAVSRSGSGCGAQHKGLLCSAGKRSVESAQHHGSPRSCIAKVSYTTHTNRMAMDAANSGYLSYIARQSATLRDKPEWELATEGEELYTFSENGTRIPLSVGQAENMLEGKNVFRIVLSPEDRGADITELARRFIDESLSSPHALQQRPYDIVAANHWDTDNPHVHMVISRQKRRGAEPKESLLHFPHSYTKDMVIQKDAGAILTFMMGPRSEREKTELVNKQVTMRGISPIDRIIQRHKSDVYKDEGIPDGAIVTEREFRHMAPKDRNKARARLEWLSQQELFVRKDPVNGAYRIQPSWKDDLYGLSKLEKLGLSGKASFDNRDARDFEGFISGVYLDNDYEERLLVTVKDREGKDHVIEQKVSGLYDDGKGAIGREVKVKADSKGRAVIEKPSAVFTAGSAAGEKEGGIER